MANPIPAAPPAEWKGGEMLFVGGTDWSMLGRSIGAKGKKDPQEEAARAELYPNVLLPSRIKTLAGVKIAFVATGPAATHCLAGDMEGRLYSWGRNEKGQLGHGDKVQRNMPTLVEGLAGEFVIAASAGKHHSSVVTKSGASFTFGLNQQGQCGIGSIKKGPAPVKGTPKFEDLQLKPVKAMLPEGVTATSCGADFTLWLAGGKCYAAGNPQYGQTGDGTDHSYNAKDSSIAICFEAQMKPKLVPALASKTITRITCGISHSIAVDNEGACHTWGCGNYGRLGHKVQKDEFAPKKVEEFRGRLSVPSDSIIAAGSTSSFCTTAPGGQLYSWGKLKSSGDNQMYPNLVNDLAGWNMRAMSCGPATFAISADNSVITWGSATNGELGYGPNGKKSSANPDKCASLEGLITHQVACGAGFTMFLVDSEAAGAERIAKFPTFECTAPEEEAVEEEEAEAPVGKGKGKAAAGGAKRKAEPAPAKAAKGKKAK